MTYFERQKYCENIIAPYKEQLSDEALAEIHSIYADYYLDDDLYPTYTAEQIETSEMIQKFELCDMIFWVLDREGFPVYDDDEEDCEYGL